jgi:hypothetical protein
MVVAGLAPWRLGRLAGGDSSGMTVGQAVPVRFIDDAGAAADGPLMGGEQGGAVRRGDGGARRRQ